MVVLVVDSESKGRAGLASILRAGGLEVWVADDLVRRPSGPVDIVVADDQILSLEKLHTILGPTPPPFILLRSPDAPPASPELTAAAARVLEKPPSLFLLLKTVHEVSS